MKNVVIKDNTAYVDAFKDNKQIKTKLDRKNEEYPQFLYYCPY